MSAMRPIISMHQNLSHHLSIGTSVGHTPPSLAGKAYAEKAL